MRSLLIIAATAGLFLVAGTGCERKSGVSVDPATGHAGEGGEATEAEAQARGGERHADEADRDHADESHDPAAEESEHVHDHAEHGESVIPIPEPVRRNLGITFARVERRAVSRTVRVPGRFELLPIARREYRTVMSGRVELAVSQFEPIEPGKLLYTLDSPHWRALQEKLNEVQGTIQQATARVETMKPLMEAHRKHEESLRESVKVWEERVQQLEKGSNVISAETFAQARSTLSQNRSDLAETMEKQAELQAREVELDSELAVARERFELLLMSASSVLGIDRQKLLEPKDGKQHEHALWKSISKIEVRAAAPGVVESLALTNGSWATETSLVLVTVQPELIRFHAQGFQSDLGRLRDGLPGRIVPPKGGSLGLQDTMEGSISLGPLANPDERTVKVFVTPERLSSWARPGVVAHLEIIAEGSGPDELAIPVSATIRDGLRTVFFRRRHENPDQVIRVEADLGLNDGRWVVVKGGVEEGDEVVLDGVYQLMLASSGTAQQGGHYDPDGTFHTGSH